MVARRGRRASERGKSIEIRRKWGRKGERGGVRDALIGCYRVFKLMYRVEIVGAGKVEERRGEKRARFDFVVKTETFLSLVLLHSLAESKRATSTD